jgi:multiple sugar transport system substrate-binding protein
MTLSRRDLLLGTAGLAAGTAGAGLLNGGPAFAQGAAPQYKPEQGATLRVLRWTPFVKGDEDSWLANTKKFTEATGVEVRVDKESWEDIRPKAAVAANVGSGPDVMLVWFDDPFQYPDKLLDVTDIGNSFASRYGGYYPGPEGYAKQGDKFIALPLAAIGNGILYRDSMVKQAGFSKFPEKSDEFLELCKALKAKSKPAGFALGKAVGDGNNGDHQGAAICPRALPDLHPGHGELARHQQQPRLPGRRRLRDGQRRLALLLGEERSEDGRTGAGHPLHDPARRPRRPTR